MSFKVNSENGSRVCFLQKLNNWTEDIKELTTVNNPWLPQSMAHCVLDNCLAQWNLWDLILIYKPSFRLNVGKREKSLMLLVSTMQFKILFFFSFYRALQLFWWKTWTFICSILAVLRSGRFLRLMFVAGMITVFPCSGTDLTLVCCSLEWVCEELWQN